MSAPPSDESLRGVVDILDDLSAETWHKVSIGPSRGLTFGEESITDHNLFELDRRCPKVEVYKFNKAEEPMNGADFEWWVGNDGTGWIGIRFQAKKLDDGNYVELRHRIRGLRQYDLLLENAWRDNVWAFYCFYNGWECGWPDDVPNAACPKGYVPTWDGVGKSACVHAALQDFGCAIAPAIAVARRHSGEPRRGHTSLEEYLRFSRPWSHLFKSQHSRRVLPSEDVTSAIASSLTGWTTAAAPDTLASQIPARRPAPPDRGIHGAPPPWLAARRAGSSFSGGYRPAVAVVLEVL